MKMIHQAEIYIGCDGEGCMNDVVITHKDIENVEDTEVEDYIDLALAKYHWKSLCEAVSTKTCEHCGSSEYKFVTKFFCEECYPKVVGKDE